MLLKAKRKFVNRNILKESERKNSKRLEVCKKNVENWSTNLVSHSKKFLVLANLTRIVCVSELVSLRGIVWSMLCAFKAFNDIHWIPDIKVCNHTEFRGGGRSDRTRYLTPHTSDCSRASRPKAPASLSARGIHIGQNNWIHNFLNCLPAHFCIFVCESDFVHVNVCFANLSACFPLSLSTLMPVCMRISSSVFLFCSSIVLAFASCGRRAPNRDRSTEPNTVIQWLY